MKILYAICIIASVLLSAASCSNVARENEANQIYTVTDTVSKSKYVIDIKPEYLESLTQSEKERLDTIIQLFDGIANICPTSEAELKETIHKDMDTLRAVAALFKSWEDTVGFEIRVPKDSLVNN